MENIDFNGLYQFWKMYADELGFDKLTFDNLTVYTTPNVHYGIHNAYFYDLKNNKVYRNKTGWETTAYHLLMNSVDHEKMVAIHIMATIFNIFDGINDRYTPEHFRDPKIYDYRHAIYLACRNKVGFEPGMIWHHRHSDVYPQTITYSKFTFYHDKILEYHTRSFDPYLIIYMAVLEAKINMERFGIVYPFDKEDLIRHIDEYHKGE